MGWRAEPSRNHKKKITNGRGKPSGDRKSGDRKSGDRSQGSHKERQSRRQRQKQQQTQRQQPIDDHGDLRRLHATVRALESLARVRNSKDACLEREITMDEFSTCAKCGEQTTEQATFCRQCGGRMLTSSKSLVAALGIVVLCGRRIANKAWQAEQDSEQNRTWVVGAAHSRDYVGAVVQRRLVSHLRR